MARATWLLVGATVVGLALSLWLYLDNRDLRAELSRRDKPAAVSAPTEKVAAARTVDTWSEPTRSTGSARTGSGPAPTLPDQAEESRLERRQRRQMEFAAMFGRLDGETEAEYRARIGPMIATGLMVPRTRVQEMRKQAEEKAGVTADQSKKLDKAFEKTYADALDYTNKAVADGMLSPYERNVSGWLEYAGGLGGILNEANGQIGQILTPQQVKAIGASGFEWGEYLGAQAPWEQLNPPPPPR